MSKCLITNNISTSQTKVAVSTPIKYIKYSNYIKVTFSFVTNKVLRNKSILDVMNLPTPRRQLRRSTHTQELRCYAATSFATRVSSSLYWHFGALGVVFRNWYIFKYFYFYLPSWKCEKLNFLYLVRHGTLRSNVSVTRGGQKKYGIASLSLFGFLFRGRHLTSILCV